MQKLLPKRCGCLIADEVLLASDEEANPLRALETWGQPVQGFETEIARGQTYADGIAIAEVVKPCCAAISTEQSRKSAMLNHPNGSKLQVANAEAGQRKRFDLVCQTVSLYTSIPGKPSFEKGKTTKAARAVGTDTAAAG